LAKFDNQRAWILDQINQGKLDGATLLYAGKSAARGQGMHPTALAEVVEQLRSKPGATTVQTEGIPKGEEVAPGIYVNQGALTQDEQMELFDYLKPYLEEQAAKTLKGNQASKMIGLGLRWDYKSNNVGRAAVNIPDVINPGNKTKYGYYDVSINNQPLGQITPRFRELMQKATGVDMTNYDGAIINLYGNDTFISSHNDVDESKSAIKYPVIGINLGGKGNFSIERIPGAGELSLEAGTGYVFGVDGVNREVWHRTFPTSQDTFLPELTTKIDGQTYPAGSYRITITMRRVKSLRQGMPIAPAINAEQLPVETVAADSAVIITEFYNSQTEDQKKILGNLEDVITKYENMGFGYSVDDYIESLKCEE
jgi:alkylated DNA repair dioxygenase AlkB